MTRLISAAKLSEWQEMAENRLHLRNAFPVFGNMVMSGMQKTPSSTERFLQIQYRYPSPLKRSVLLDRPLFSVLYKFLPPHFEFLEVFHRHLRAICLRSATSLGL